MTDLWPWRSGIHSSLAFWDLVLSSDPSILHSGVCHGDTGTHKDTHSMSVESIWKDEGECKNWLSVCYWLLLGHWLENVCKVQVNPSVVAAPPHKVNTRTVWERRACVPPRRLQLLAVIKSKDMLLCKNLKRWITALGNAAEKPAGRKTSVCCRRSRSKNIVVFRTGSRAINCTFKVWDARSSNSTDIPPLHLHTVTPSHQLCKQTMQSLSVQRRTFPRSAPGCNRKLRVEQTPEWVYSPERKQGHTEIQQPPSARPITHVTLFQSWKPRPGLRIHRVH